MSSLLQYRIIFLGDIVGRPGREAVLNALPTLKNELRPTFIIVNGENSAHGVGITPDIADSLYKAGVDAITLGNHAFNKREIYDYLQTGRPIVRPANASVQSPGRGLCTVMRDGVQLAVANVCGRVYMDGYDDPFPCVDRLIAEANTPHFLLDFHAEATSEKIAMGFYCDGKVTAVLGTHTHVATADEQILAGGTAYQTDVGMCGPWPSVLGMEKSVILRKFLTGMPTKFEVAEAQGVISGVVIDVHKETGRAIAIRRLPLRPTPKH